MEARKWFNLLHDPIPKSLERWAVGEGEVDEQHYCIKNEGVGACVEWLEKRVNIYYHDNCMLKGIVYFEFEDLCQAVYIIVHADLKPA